MKKIGLLVIIASLSLLPAFNSFAIDLINNVEIINREGISDNTDWFTIDLSQYSPWQKGIRSLYIEMYSLVNTECINDTIWFELRPYNDGKNIRRQSIITTGDTGNDAYVQYVWTPLKENNKIQYRISGIQCKPITVNIRLAVLGYDF